MGVSRGSARPLVLIVDDDGPILDSLGEILVEEGYAVALARNGQEALAYLAANTTPDCIVLDVMMPVMNGYEFRRAQLRDPRLANIPTLLLTAGHVDGRVADMRLSGWLRKPINLPMLLASVQQHCRLPGEAPEPPFPGHEVHLYLEESRMLERAAQHLVAGLEAGAPAMAVCTPSHWDGVRDRLVARRLEPGVLERGGRLVWLDAGELVQRIRAGRSQGLDGPGLRRHVHGALERLRAEESVPVQVFGEAVNLLWQDGQFQEARELEDAWNRFGTERPMSLLCSYASAGARDERQIHAVCQQHAQVTRDLA